MKFLFVGHSKLNGVSELEAIYLKKIKNHDPSAVLIVAKDSKARDIAEKKRAEEQAIFKLLKPEDFLILCDEKGKHFTSREFAAQLEKWKIVSKNLVFLVGGPFGFTDAVKSRSQTLISFSKLTFPHDLAKIILLEQVYRAHAILAGSPYHHD